MSTLNLWLFLVCGWITVRGLYASAKSIGWDSNVLYALTRSMLSGQDGSFSQAIGTPIVALAETMLLPVQIPTAILRGTVNKHMTKRNEVQTVEDLFDIIIDLEERHIKLIKRQERDIDDLMVPRNIF